MEELSEEEKKKLEEKEASEKAAADKKRKAAELIQEYKDRFNDWSSDEHFKQFLAAHPHQTEEITSPEVYLEIIAEYKKFITEVIGESEKKDEKEETEEYNRRLEELAKEDANWQKADAEEKKAKEDQEKFEDLDKGLGVNEGIEDTDIQEDIKTNENGERERYPWEKEVIAKLKAYAKRKYPTAKDNNFILDDSKPGLYIEVKDTVFHYADQNKVTFGRKDGTIPEMDDFREIVGTAKDAIGFGNIRDDEYKARLMVACLEAGVDMENAPNFESLQNVSEETKKAYEKIKEKQNSENSNEDVVEKQIDIVKNRLITRDLATGDLYAHENLEGKTPLASVVETKPIKVDTSIEGQSPLLSVLDKPSKAEVIQKSLIDNFKNAKNAKE